MKNAKTVLVLGLAAATFLTGCVPIQYTRSITVKRDANGKIIETVEFEGITEPHNETPKIKEIKTESAFQHLK